MRNYLFVGDTHGDLDFFQRAAEEAALHGAEIIQVGDWGFAWPGRDGVVRDQVRELQRILRVAGEMYGQPPVTCRHVDGNHDCHPWLRERTAAFSDAMETLEGGGHALYMDCPNVIYQPRGSTHRDEDGTTFLFCGGAPSIDWMLRTEGRSIWRQDEVISEDDFRRCLDVEGTIHVLVTHDAPQFPPGYGPKGDPWFVERGRQSMNYVNLLAVQHLPELVVHGHWHKRYSTVVELRHACNSRVEGLASNLQRFEDAVMLWSRGED